MKKKYLLMLCALFLSFSFTPLSQAAAGKVKVQWLGHAAFKITSVNGKVILVDPFLTGNPKTPKKYKDLSAIGKVDLILITHAHGDHVGDSIKLAKMHKASIYAPPGLNDTLLSLGLLPKKQLPRFNKGGVVKPLGNDISITMTRAEHSSEFKWKNKKTGKLEIHVGGEPAGFIIQLESGFKIYHMGDTGLFGDMKFIGGYYKPNLILMPIGGHYVMSPVDAAYATKKYLKPDHVMPMHYGTIPVLKGTVAEFKQALGGAKNKVVDIAPGQTRSY